MFRNYPSALTALGKPTNYPRAETEGYGITFESLASGLRALDWHLLQQAGLARSAQPPALSSSRPTLFVTPGPVSVVVRELCLSGLGLESKHRLCWNCGLSPTPLQGKVEMCCLRLERPLVRPPQLDAVDIAWWRERERAHGLQFGSPAQLCFQGATGGMAIKGSNWRAGLQRSL